MPLIKYTEVLGFSSEDENHPAKNLLKPDSYLKWKSKSGQWEKQEYVILKLEKLSSIYSIDIGNDNSAFVEVLVSRNGSDYKVLLVASAFMSPLESRYGNSSNRVRMFSLEKLTKEVASQKWDRVKIVCTQPFNKKVQFGLAFINLHSSEETPNTSHKESTSPSTSLGRFSLQDENEEAISIGSFFEKRKEKQSPLKGAAAIRAASKQIDVSGDVTSKKRTIEDSPNAPQMGFYQLKKKQKDDSPSTPKRDSNSKNNLTPSRLSRDIPNQKKTPSSTDNKRSPKKALAEKVKKTKPFNELMDDVIFVLSGYQNPLRSRLRDLLVSMGAKYKADWSKGCTHLICAFKNTPKYNAVLGKGKIVSEKWIEKCHSKKIRIPWRRFSLESSNGSNQNESEDEIWASELIKETPQQSQEREDVNMYYSDNTDDEIELVLQTKGKQTTRTNKGSPKKESAKNSSTSKNPGKKFTPPSKKQIPPTAPTSDEDYEADTDVDDETETRKETDHLPLPTLKSFFKNKNFFLYNVNDEAKRKEITRYIVAYEGEIHEYMNDNVNFVLTDEQWDEHFDEALEANSCLQFVKTQWIWKCCDKEKFIPPQPYFITHPTSES